MRYEPGREEKWRNYLSPDRLEKPFVRVIQGKTLADAKLCGKTENGRHCLVVNFFDDEGKFIKRVELASFDKRKDARTAVREILGINPKHKPEIVINE